SFLWPRASSSLGRPALRVWNGPVHLVKSTVSSLSAIQRIGSSDEGKPRRSTAQNASIWAVPLRPGMKVLFMSGNTDGMIACHGTMESGITILRKSFKREDLARRVEEVLAEVTGKGRP